MPFDAEVIVAGAGPAGAVAARTLAAAGIDTLLVDRAAFPRYKACGGGISTRVLPRFPWLSAAIDGIDQHTVRRLHLEGPGGTALDLESERPCVLLVRRLEFDHALVRAAVDAGGRVSPGFEITQTVEDASGVTLQARDGRRLKARVVVAADGVHSVMAKRLGVNPRWPRHHLAIDMMEETPTSILAPARPDVLWVAYAYGNLDGYAYVFPKAHHVNVGIGCLLSHFDANVSAPPYELQKTFVGSLVERGVLRGGSDRASFTPFLIPVGGPLKRAWQGRVLFAGDAGGFVNAITAEGIYYAMVSGELAGLAISEARRAGRIGLAGPGYERRWRGELFTELRDATVLQRYLFSRHDRVAAVVRGASRPDRLTDAILQYTRGELSYQALRRRVLFRFPLTALRLVRQQLRRRAAVA